ncbi:MAG: hypothetical protein WBN22_01035 [Verrucomicrobiia bacterium]
MKHDWKFYLIVAGVTLGTIAIARFVKNTFTTLIPASIAAYLP